MGTTTPIPYIHPKGATDAPTLHHQAKLPHLDVIEQNRKEKTLTITLKGSGYSVDFRQFGEWQEQEMVYQDVFPFMEELDDVEEYFESPTSSGA